MTRLQHNEKPGHANTSLCSPEQIQIMSEAGFCLFIGNITVKLLLLLAGAAKGYPHSGLHVHTYTVMHMPCSHIKESQCPLRTLSELLSV